MCILVLSTVIKKKTRADVSKRLCLNPNLLPHVDAAQWCHVTVFVLPKHFAHGAGGCLTGEAVDVDLLFFMLVTHQLLLLLLRLLVHQPGRDGYIWIHHHWILCLLRLHYSQRAVTHSIFTRDSTPISFKTTIIQQPYNKSSLQSSLQLEETDKRKSGTITSIWE